jgi:iron(III) transport system ATP-binding protein
VAVARALVVEPEILLLDEPLSNLDANLREEMRVEIRRLHEAFGITTLYVTHDQAEAMVISDRIAVIERGRVAQVGTADELFDAPRSRFVAEFIGKTNVVDAVAIAPDTVERGGLRLRVAAAGLAPGARVTLSIRPHLVVPVAAGEAGSNVLAGTVRRASLSGRRDGIRDRDRGLGRGPARDGSARAAPARRRGGARPHRSRRLPAAGGHARGPLKRVRAPGYAR